MRTLIVAITLLMPTPVLAQGDPAAAPPPATAEATVAADISADATVTAEPGVAAPAGFTIGLAPRIGMAVPTSKLGITVVGGVEVDFFLAMQRRLVVAFDFTVTRPSYAGSGNDARVGGDYQFTVKELELKLGLDLVYRFFAPPRRLVPFAGIGAILHMLRTTQTNSLAPGENTEQSSKLGAEVVAGVDYGLGPGALLLEGRFVYSGLDHVLTGDVNAGSLTVSLGYRFIF